ncbi:MAG: anthranilate synthase component I family protein [Planctomycetaceae bacterium]|jgi:anthranilate synthase component 1|nr:anthranilate synthase component I family protein [Planctomycetaceae bacterium]
MINFQSFQSACQHYGVVPVTKQVLADFHTPVSLLNRFCRDENGTNFSAAHQTKIKEGLFLLESAEGGEKWGRYSFLGIEPYCFVNIEANDVVVRYERPSAASVENQRIPHNGKPLNVLRELMKQYNTDEHPELPRFWGGLVGFFNYETAAFFEKIPHKLKDEPLACFVIPRTLLILDNIKQTLTICVLTFPSPGSTHSAADDWKQLYQSALAEIDRVAAELEKPLATPQPEKTEEMTLESCYSEQEFRKRVGIVKEHIKNGDIIQCVLSQPFIAENAPNPVPLYRALRFVNPAPYLFFMNIGGTTLVGSSPETMVRLEGKTATLRPIAGTRKRGETEQHDRELADEMLQDTKERAEHLMLVDLGRNDLGRIAKTGTVQVTDLMFIERYAHVMHLVSNVTAELDSGYDGFDLFEAAFPAGTLTGAPKIRAMQIIAGQEDFPRRAYGGAAGYISFSGNIDFAITIRTAMIQNGKLTVQAGAGVVYDSVPESERKESVNKALGIARALKLLSGE